MAEGLGLVQDRGAEGSTELDTVPLSDDEALKRLLAAARNYAREVVEQWGDGDEYLNTLAEAAVDYGMLVGWDQKVFDDD